MAVINAIQTVGGVLIINVDSNPSTGLGTPAPIGSFSIAEDGSGTFYKGGALATDWYKTIQSNNLSTLNILIVSKNPIEGEFATIEDALASISTNSPTNPFVIKVDVGIFMENQLNCKPYVSIIGTSIQDTIIKPIGNHDLFVITDVFNELSFMSLQSVPLGKAAIFCNDCGSYAQAHKVNFVDCDINLKVVAITKDTYFYGEYLDYNGIYSYGTKVNASSGFIASVNLENYYNLPSSVGTIGTYLSGSKASCNILASGNVGANGGIAFYIENDSEIFIDSSTYITNWDMGIHIANVGLFSTFSVIGCRLENNSIWDLFVEHPLAIGSFSGVANVTKMSNASSLVGWNFLDSITGNLEITNSLNITFKNGTHTDVSTLFVESSTMGLIKGGLLTDGGGLNLNISSGYGYFEQIPDVGVIEKLNWNNLVLPLTANSDNYIYFNNSGIISQNASRPDSIFNIILGRVVTNGTGIELIVESSLNSEHTSNRFASLFRNAIGSIYASGSLVTENVTPFHLNVSNGEYYFSTNEYLPSGFTNGTFTPVLGGVIQTPTNIVNNTQYDVSGVLTPISAGFYVKHSLYVSGEGVNEKYYLVYATSQYNSLLSAQQANIPTPPSFIKGAVSLIAGIIIQQGAISIIQIRDLRPVVGFKSEGVNASADHLSLLNLNAGANGDGGHTNLFTVNGAKPMLGNLNMNGNAIVNVTTINGILPSYLFKKGGQAFGANAILGLTDAFSLSLITNNLDRIVISSAGVITINDLSGSGTKVIGVNNTGDLINTVTTTNLQEGTNLYYLDSRVILAPLTGYVSGAGVVSATDSILQAIQKLNGNISALVTGVSSVSGTTNRITSTGGANPIIDISASYIGQASITTLGTISTGTLSSGAIIGGVTMTLGSDASFDTYYRAVGGVLTRLPNGTTGQVLTATTGSAPSWVTNGVGTVTSVSALTLGTTGTDLSSTVANSTTTPVITLNVPTASATNRGALSSTDWSTFNSKQSAITLTVTGNNGASTFISNTLNIPTYTLSGLGGQPLATNLTSLSGLTFVSTSFVKMTALGTFSLDTNTYLTANQTITLSGEAIGSGNTAITVTLTNSAVIGKVLTGYVSGAGVVSATDSILQAIQKLNGNISALVTGVSSVSGTTNRITSTGGANPIIDISASYIGQASITTLGTISTGTWSATAISANFGGTGQTVYAVGDLLSADTTTTLSKIASVATGSYLRSAGVGTLPIWSTLVLPNSATTGDLLFASATNTITSLADVATGNALISGGVGIAPSYGKIGLTTHISGILAGTNGGTGVNNGAFLITIAGNLTTTGAFNTTFSAGATTTHKLPITTSTLVGCVFANSVNSNTITGTTLTDFNTNFTFPANSLGIVGKHVRIRAKGIYSVSAAGQTLTLLLRKGATTILTTGARASQSTATNNGWNMEAEFYVVSTGAGGTIRSDISTMFAEGVFADGSIVGSNGTQAFDTTISNLMTLSANFGGAAAGNVITIESITYEILN